MSKKNVKIGESELVDLIEGIVEESIAERLVEEKKKWLAENKIEANAVLLERIKVLQETVNKFLKG